MNKNIIIKSRTIYFFMIITSYVYIVYFLYKVNFIPRDYMSSMLIDEYSLFYFYIPIIIMILFNIFKFISKNILVSRGIKINKIIFTLNFYFIITILLLIIPLLNIFYSNGVLRFTINIIAVFNIYLLLFLISNFYFNYKLSYFIPIFTYIADLFLFYLTRVPIILSTNNILIILVLKYLILYFLLYLLILNLNKGWDINV